MTQSAISSRLASSAGTALRNAPGIVGPVLIVIGLWMFYHFLGVIAAGVILWLADRRIP